MSELSVGQNREPILEPQLTAGGPAVRALTVVCAILGLCPVVALVAWASGLGPFRTWFWATAVPAVAALMAIGAIAGHRPRYRPIHDLLRVGSVAGIFGTFAYDIFRFPFTALGYRLLAPIDSYGVLALNASSSSPRTGLVGWAFHFSNGVGFGITYAAVARGRRWTWGLAWGMAIETLALATPVAGLYALRGPVVLALAYGGHLAYGATVGRIVAHPERTTRLLAEVSLRSTTYLVLAVTLTLVLWQRPWSTPASIRVAKAVAAGPSAIVVGGRFSPQWLRVAPGHCIALRDDDPVGYQLAAAGASGRGLPYLEPARTTQACFAANGVHRIRTSKAPYAGGFVIVDPEAG